jgi:hypothetical protein
MAHDPSPLRKVYVYNEETMLRFMDQYWDFFEDATQVPDKNDPYWVVTMRRPKRRTDVVELRPSPPDNGAPPATAKKQ